MDRLLFVDDEPFVLRALKRTFELEGFQVVTAHRPADALELLQKDPGFVVIGSDYRMPEMNGAEFLQRARDLAPQSYRLLISAVEEFHAAEFLHRGDEQAVALGRQVAGALEELGAVHLRHAVVRADHDEARPVAEQLERVRGAVRGDHLEALELERALQRTQHEGLVVHEKEAVHDPIVIGRIGRILRGTFSYSVPGKACSAPSPIQTVFQLTNSRIPITSSSRPWPLDLMPPKGRRGSDFTMPLMNTWPACNSSVKRRTSPASRVHAAEPRPNFVALASWSASPASRTLKSVATGPKISSSRPGVPGPASVSSVGWKKNPGRSMRLPPASTLEPLAIMRFTWSSRSSSTCFEESGPTSVDSSFGSPTRSSDIRFAMRWANSSWMRSCTMKRLAAMQLCPAFCTRA